MKAPTSPTEFDIRVFAREVSKEIYSRFGSKPEEIAENAVKVLVSIYLKPFLVSCKSKGSPQQAIKNLTNAWYSECFLSYPSVHSMKDQISEKRGLKRELAPTTPKLRPLKHRGHGNMIAGIQGGLFI